LAEQNTGVRTQHPLYMATLDKWIRCRAVSDGQDAVHHGKEHFLPRLKEQENEDYDAYVMRTPFYNATWRTIAGLSGMMFRKEPKIDAADALLELCKDVTLSGVSLTDLAKTVAIESMEVGRVGLLVDYPQTDPTLTRADAPTMNLQPTMNLYRAESIINWRTKMVANKQVLALVVLAEQHSEQVDDFTEKVEMRYRALDLVAAPTVDGQRTLPLRYRVRMFRIDDKGKDEQVGVDLYPQMDGKAMDFIPFTFIGTDDTTPEVDDPPLIDLVNMNLSHYRTSADYEHGCHFTGLPTAVIAGYRVEPQENGTTEKFSIGSPTAWVFPDAAAHANYLEFTGQGLGALQTNLERKEQQMAVLGARMLEALKRGVESAQTASIHRVGEESALTSIAQTVSAGLTKALQWYARWASLDDNATIELNRDFYPAPMDPMMLQQLVAAWQAGAFGYDTLFANLKQGELIAPERTVEDEQSAVQNQPPLLMAPPTTPSPQKPHLKAKSAPATA
jgi:hypothetical protein